MPEPVQLCYRQLGMKIEQLRTALGWTQEDLAKKLNMARGSVANIETGRQRVLMHDIETIATAFGSTPKQLLRGIWT